MGSLKKFPPELFYNPRQQRRVAAGYPPPGYSASYVPANYVIDGHAPTNVPDLAMTAPHDWDSFLQSFPKNPDGTARTPATTPPQDTAPSAPPPSPSAPAAAKPVVAKPVVASPGSTASATRTPGKPAPGTSAPANSSAPPPAFNGNVTNAPSDPNSSAVQGLLDKASGVQPTSPTSPTNTATPYGKGSVRFDPSARDENQRQEAYDRATSGEDGPIMVSKRAPTGQVIPDAKGNQIGVQGDTYAARQNLFANHPEVFKDGTPENAAIVKYAKSTNPLTGQPYGEDAAIANADNLVKGLAKGPAASSPIVTGPQGEASASIPSNVGLQNDAPLYRPGSLLDSINRVAQATGGPTDILKDGVNKVAGWAGYQKPVFTSPPEKPYTPLLPNDSDQKEIDDYVKTLPAGSIGHYDPANDPEESGTGETPKGPGSAHGQLLPTDESYAHNGLSHSNDTTQSLPAANRSVEAQRYATGPDGKPDTDVPLGPVNDSAPAADPEPVPSDARGGFVPNYAFGSATADGDSDRIDLADNMRRANSVRNEFHPPADAAVNSSGNASGFQSQAASAPKSQPTAAERAEAASWKGNMQAAQNTLNSYDKQYDPGAGTMTEQLAGPNGPMATVEGTPPPENFARGRVPGYAAGRRRLFAPALRREQRAIAAGIGGAPRTAKAQPVVLGGHPAVINSSEKLMPTPAGVAVLNRDMQRRLRLFAPGRK